MGGRVFPGKTRRFEKTEYLNIYAELIPRLHMLTDQHNLCPHVKDKESFGDMDIVVCMYDNPQWNTDLLKTIFDTEHVSKNGSCWSLVYKEMQIDLITAPEDEYKFTCFYFGQSDQGNFAGKVAHNLGVKLGHDGLWLPIRLDNNHSLGDILLTRDVDEALRFLDIKVLTEYDSVMQMFGVVAASKYFNPESYKLENNNSVARVRDKKRPNYKLFLDYCATLPDDDWFPRLKDKSIFLPLIFAAFDVKEEYDRLFAEKEKRDRVADKFNGDLVSEWTGEEGPALGSIMKAVKQQLTIDQLDGMSTEQIQEYVKSVMTGLYEC